MSFEPVLFNSTMFETANDAFLFCKAYLEKKGHLGAARHLEGLDPINGDVMGRLALQALHDVVPFVKDESLEYVHIAINAMQRALGVRPVRNVA